MRTPVSTYRLQINKDFDLHAAARALSYLHRLGVDWVYLSPLLAAEKDSNHGYDVSDHGRIDAARGGVSGLSAVSAEAHRLGMGVLVDIVPNHVGVARASDNAWWWSVLTHGQGSSYADAFDIDWAAGGGRVRIPVVGDDDLVDGGVDGGTIDNLRVEAGQLRYHDHAFPLAPGSADPGLDPGQVHARQHYELVSWRVADAGLNYRRFFAVNSLAAIRVEEQEWFDRSHDEIGRWFAEGLVDGLRVDHPDGLRDPEGYLRDLADLTGDAYVLVEKILEPGEELPVGWATAGTTGYDAMALIDRVLTDPAAVEPLGRLDERLRGATVDWAEMVHDNKRAIADGILRSEVLRIGRELRVALSRSGVADAPADIEDAVAEIIAWFPVYRSYLPGGRDHLDEAFALARQHRPELDGTLAVLLPVLSDPEQPAALRFQQTSGMVMAKGVEDCSFYRWSRLTSLNEVGADPSVFSVTAGEWHDAMTTRQREWPHAMTSLSTHDTKRGEDVRARITALAEVPDLWERSLDQLLELVPLPDPGFGNLLWQAIVGAWPARGLDGDLRQRLHGYAEKAMREAGDRTTWTAPDHDYEAAVHAAVDAALDRPDVRAVLDEVLTAVADAGWSNSLAAKLVAITMPGVPDVYQGSELWEQSLVDPDNRRPVDLDVRTQVLDSIEQGSRPALDGGVDDAGAAKLLVTRACLLARREQPDLFGSYAPVVATGEASGHVLAFDRGGAITVATRLPVGLAARGGWGDTSLALPAGEWTDTISGRVVSGDVALAELLSDLPVALLLRHTTPIRATHDRFDVWAPRAGELTLQVGDQRIAMSRGTDDWWTPTEPVPDGEVDYGYLVDDAEQAVPDPRSRRQPDGVHALSRTFDPAAHVWAATAWTGRQLAGSVIYELHVGTFTPEGTFDAASTKLDHLRSIGVDFVELMPVNAFNGTHNWGYDGVLWSAVHEVYGGPAAYQRFVDGCHAAGIGVIQDVVHNHLGPSGNYLPLFGPYLKAGANTWGDLVNLDGEGSEEVRRFILDSVRMWFTDMHVDGLRLDAVHALSDSSPVHLLEEMAVEVAALSAHQRRPLTLIAESDLNDPHLVTPREGGGFGLDAQWSDDFHHAVHVALTGETEGYYADFEPLSALGKVLAHGFFHDGTFSSFRNRPHGVAIDVERVPSWRLVVSSQNHDQIGNRARGDRITEALDDDQLACAALLTLTSPFTPMLFQGEEWAASTPFAFFTSHPEPELGLSTAQGRLVEFERMGWDPAVVPDPQDPMTFERSKLDWDEIDSGRHAVLLDVYRRLAALRRELPELTEPDLRRVDVTVDEEARTLILRRGVVVVVVNMGEQARSVPLSGEHTVLFTTPAGASLGAQGLALPPHAGALLRRTT